MTQTGTPQTSGESMLLSQARAAGIDIQPMLDMIPDAGGDAYVNILKSIATASSIEELAAAFKTDSLANYENQWLTVTGLRKMPSDFADGLGVYLVIDADVNTSGEHVVVSTGSVTCVAQLVRANALGALPCIIKPVKAARPTRDGYTPWHLEFFTKQAPRANG